MVSGVERFELTGGAGADTLATGEGADSIFGGAGAVGALQLAVTRPAVVVDVPSLVAVLWLGLATTTLAYALFVRGLAGVGAATAATLTLAEPVVAAALGLVVLGERLGWNEWAGIGLIVIANTVVSLSGAGAARMRKPHR